MTAHRELTVQGKNNYALNQSSLLFNILVFGNLSHHHQLILRLVNLHLASSLICFDPLPAIIELK